MKRAIAKKITGPLRYRSSRGYDARRYWTDRFSKYGSSLQGAGHEGLSEEENQAQYAEAAEVFKRVVTPLLDAVEAARVLEIGVGTGFFTRLLKELGVSDYTGVDITDALFAQHRADLEDYRFVQGDVTKDPIEGAYDLGIMIDVTEHIVSREELQAAFHNVRRAILPGGTFLVGPQVERSRKHLFYVHFWSADDVRSSFGDWSEIVDEPFRDGRLLGFRKPV